MNWYLVLMFLSICFVKFMFICIWKRMRDMNDKLIATIILRWVIFISIWLTLTAPVNTSNYGMKFCTGIYNDHDQIMNSNNPNQTPSPYAPLLLLIYFSIITLTVSIWFKKFKNSAIEPLASKSKSPFVQRPKDMESMLANFSLVNLIAINSVVTIIWREYENYKIIRIIARKSALEKTQLSDVLITDNLF